MSGCYYTDEEVEAMDAQHAEVCAEIERLREDLELQRKIDLQIIAEKQQLRGNLSLAEEGLANYAQENERLKAALQTICDRWRAPLPRLEHETDLEAAINERDDLYGLAADALRGVVPQSAPQSRE